MLHANSDCQVYVIDNAGDELEFTLKEEGMQGLDIQGRFMRAFSRGERYVASLPVGNYHPNCTVLWYRGEPYVIRPVKYTPNIPQPFGRVWEVASVIPHDLQELLEFDTKCPQFGVSSYAESLLKQFPYCADREHISAHDSSMLIAHLNSSYPSGLFAE